MRTTLIAAALAAMLATAATATTTMHHRHMVKTDSGSAAVRDLNQKSLQQASAGGTMAAPMASQPAMNDGGTPAPGMSSMPMSTPNATPDAPAPDAQAPATPPQ